MTLHLRRGTALLLARLEGRACVRLDQAANRMEDADPVSIAVAAAAVRALDAIDRITGFRARHARAGRDRVAERPPAPRPPESPPATTAPPGRSLAG